MTARGQILAPVDVDERLVSAKPDRAERGAIVALDRRRQPDIPKESFEDRRVSAVRTEVGAGTNEPTDHMGSGDRRPSGRASRAADTGVSLIMRRYRVP